MKVAVLGCGPTGLVAAHAATLWGADVDIYSRPVKSAIFGAQYLWDPIPETDSGEPRIIRYSLHGSLEGYLKKVYGPHSTPDPGMSADLFNGDHKAWDIRRLYNELWDKYGPLVRAKDIRPAHVARLLSEYDRVISTIPMPRLCDAGHSFDSQAIYAMGDSDSQSVPVSIKDGYVLYEGEAEPAWHRASNIFGYKTAEWPTFGAKPSLPVARVPKPTSHNCDCFPSVIRIGRFGMWDRSILVHHAFGMSMDALDDKPIAVLTKPHFSPCPLGNPYLNEETANALGCCCA